MNKTMRNKRTVLKVIVLSFFIYHLSFSPVVAQTVNFGIKGGLDATEMKLKGALDASNRMGWFIGPTVRASIPFLGFDVSLLYNQRESKIKLTNDPSSIGYDGTPVTNTTISETVKTQQVILPVNARFSFGMGDRAGLYVFAGPQLAFNIGDSEKKLFDQVAEWSVNSSNFSFNIGAGVQFGSVQISVNYNAALGNTGEVKTLSASETRQKYIDTDGKYDAWQMALAYYF